MSVSTVMGQETCKFSVRAVSLQCCKVLRAVKGMKSCDAETIIEAGCVLYPLLHVSSCRRTGCAVASSVSLSSSDRTELRFRRCRSNYMEDVSRIEALQSLETALSEHFPLTGARKRSQLPKLGASALSIALQASSRQSSRTRPEQPWRPRPKSTASAPCASA